MSILFIKESKRKGEREMISRFSICFSSSMEKLGKDKKQIKMQSQDLLGNTHIMTAFSDCDSNKGLGRNRREIYDPVRRAIKHILLQVDDQTDGG